MTEHEIAEMLINIDKGYVPSFAEKHKLASIKIISLHFYRQVPKSIGLLKNLTALILSRNDSLEDISALSNLTTLMLLDLSGNNTLTDISALSKLKKLIFLSLRGTNVSDISALSSLTALKYLNLSVRGSADLLYSSVISKSLDERDEFLQYYVSGLYSKIINRSSETDSLATQKYIFDLYSNRTRRESELDSIYFKKYISDLQNKSLESDSLKKNYFIFDNKEYLNYLAPFLTRGVIDISPLSNLTNLMILDLHNTQVSDINALFNLKELIVLFLGETQVSDVNALSNLKKLEALDLGDTEVSDISALSRLTELKYLNIRSTNVRDISSISGLTSLNCLNLSNLTLLTIPEFLLDLNLNFNSDRKFNIEGINIFGLELIEQPIEILSQNRELIRAYYRSQDKVPINECKVIFLGDAEAGKTHSIKRLLNKGEKLINFNGNSTPGIEITVSSTTIEDTDIVVNYWDFGGQEIQHSMHRMFLTERTVYVVFLNARQDPLDERARYWIENINSFAPRAPILLVINKIDQNDRPKFNEEGIRAAYKDQIKDVVRMSALNDDPEIFLEELQGSINEIIKELPTASTMVPKSWKSLMEDLRGTSQHYLTTNEFKKKCEFYYVNNYDKIHNSLVNLFQDIGVSFCYYKDRSIADYMLLNPKWLVNALYTIVTNSKEITQNGIIQQADLYDVLKEDNINGIPIRRVVPDWRYEGIQVNYILGVIRMFRLSYQLKDGSEFFPMLCDGNEKISVNEAVSPKALHYIFQYTYLPANVLHRLIVEKQRELDYNFVWYSGAVFINEAQEQKAYVHSIGNSLHIYVDCYDSFYNPNEYLTPLLNEVRSINQDMGLQAEELIGIRVNGEKAEISYDSLIGNLKTGNKHLYVSKKIGTIDIGRTIFRYNDYRPTGDWKLINTVIDALLEMLNEPIFHKIDENARNRFIARQLRSAGYNCGDQVPGGLSATGKSIGARDGVIKDKDNHDISIFEGLNLEGLVKAKINLHLDKLLINYNPQGLHYGMMVVYLNCGRDRYKGFIDKYIDYIKDYAPEKYTCISSPSIEWTSSNGQFLTCIKMNYECGDYYYTIYHIVAGIVD